MIDTYLNSFDWAASTRDRYAAILRDFLVTFPDPALIGPSDVLAWLKAHQWGPSSRALALSVVKGFLSWRFGALHPAMPTRVKRVKSPTQRSLNIDQVFKLLASFDTSKPKGRRDLSMAALFLDAGLRVSELARLDLRYVDLTLCSLQVIVKGGNWESGVFSEYTANFLASWLADRAQIVQPGVQAVFVSTHRDAGSQMGRGSIGRIIAGCAEAAGVERLSPHDLRRTFATISTQFGAPSRILQTAGRWKSPEMIERYTPAISQSDFRRFFPVAGVLDD